MYLWRAVDHAWQVLDMLTRNRDRGLRFTNSVSQTAINVFADQVVGIHDRPLIEVAAPATQ